MGGYLEHSNKGELVLYKDHIESVLALNVEIKKLKKQLTKLHELI